MAEVRKIFLNKGLGGGHQVTVDSDLVAANAVIDTDFTAGIGRKADTAVTTLGTTASLMAYLKGLVQNSGIVPATVPTSLANGETTLFTIAGGDVAITELYAKVTTVVQTAATTVKLTFDATETGADIDLDAGTLSLNAAAVGNIIRCTGDWSDALIMTLNAVEAPGYNLHRSPMILSPGAIHVNYSAARTGVIKWYVRYISYGGTITAA